MKPYTNNDPSFSGTISIYERTDPVDADTVDNVPIKALQDNSLYLKAVTDALRNFANVLAGVGLHVSGSGSGRTLSLVNSENQAVATVAVGDTIYTHPAYTARTGYPRANAAPAFGGTVTVSQIVTDAQGHVTAATDRTITIPSSGASAAAAGLLPALPGDNAKYMDGEGQWSVPPGTYTHPSHTARTGKPTANQTPSFGGTFTVSQITSDAQGHVTAATDRTITIPAYV
ncbi:MAG: hypothetical protein IJF88_01235, partial [Oscillospiraceae bacterium]|nr:hypothetical protein [Oscillospiraceae bacterium]